MIHFGTQPVEQQQQQQRKIAFLMIVGVLTAFGLGTCSSSMFLGWKQLKGAIATYRASIEASFEILVFNREVGDTIKSTAATKHLAIFSRDLTEQEKAIFKKKNFLRATMVHFGTHPLQQKQQRKIVFAVIVGYWQPSAWERSVHRCSSPDGSSCKAQLPRTKPRGCQEARAVGARRDK